MFGHYETKSSTYSTTMNMTTCILLAIYFHVYSYDYIFTKLYSNLSLHIIESLYLRLHIMDPRRKYERVTN